MDIKEDLDFEEYTIEEVELKHEEGARGTWSVTLEFGFNLSWPRGGGYPQPRKGNIVRLYGEMDAPLGLRGVTLPEREASVYYRTPEEHEVWKEETVAADYEQKKGVFAERKEEYWERMSRLPEKLRTWFQAEREAAPDRDRFDVLELGVMLVLAEHVHMLTLVLEDRAALETFMGFPTPSKMGTIWHSMADLRVEAIEKMFARGNLEDDAREALEAEKADIERYIEQRFDVSLPAPMMSDLFELTHDLLPEWEDPTT